MAAREKNQNTSKAKAKADTMAQQILTQQGYNALKTKVSPTPNPKPTLSEEQRQKKALAELMKKRAAEAKKTGNWPNYRTN